VTVSLENRIDREVPADRERGVRADRCRGRLVDDADVRGSADAGGATDRERAGMDRISVVSVAADRDVTAGDETRVVADAGRRGVREDVDGSGARDTRVPPTEPPIAMSLMSSLWRCGDRDTAGGRGKRVVGGGRRWTTLVTMLIAAETPTPALLATAMLPAMSE